MRVTLNSTLNSAHAPLTLNSRSRATGADTRKLLSRCGLTLNSTLNSNAPLYDARLHTPPRGGGTSK